MGQLNPPIVTFTGGIVGKLLHNRVDIQSYPTAAEQQLNCLPSAQGPLGRRPSLKYIDEFVDSAQKGKLLPFVFSVEQSYIILATESGFEFFTRDGKIEIENVSTQLQDTSFTQTTVDRVQAATVTALSTGGTGTLANLKDSSAANWWESTAADTQWIRFDLGTARRIREMRIVAPNVEFDRTPNEFYVEASATGSFTGEQTAIFSTASLSAFTYTESSVVRFRLSPTTSYRYWRIVMTNKQEALGGANEYRIAGIQMYDLWWRDESEGASNSTLTGGKLYLDSDGANESAVVQELGTTIGVSYILKINIFHGPINLDIGSAFTAFDLAREFDLATGVHYIEFTATSTITYIKLWHDANAGRIVDSAQIVTGTTRLLVEHPYLEEDLTTLHFQQIGDVLYLANEGHWPRRLVRRGHRSWSVERFLPLDGPFGTQNTGAMTLTPSATSGQITLSASENYFDAEDDEDCLFEITGPGQAAELTANSSDQYTSGIRVYGVADAQRTFQIEITGSWTGSIHLQRSSGNENNYTDFRVYTTNIVEAIDDNLDNQTWYYRLAIKPGGLSAGTVTMRIFFTGGSSTGRCRIISVTSPLVAIAEVITPFSNIGAFSTWKRGEWSAKDGFPVTVTRGFGRLWLARGIKLWSSKSDNFTSFEGGSEADNAITFSIAAPSSDAVRCLAFLQHLVVGTATTESIGLGNTQSEPVGPTNFQIVPSSEEGVSRIMPVTVAGSVLYAHRNNRKLMQFTQNPKALSETSYISVDLNRLSPDLLKAGIKSLGVQNEPERRNHLVLGDGSVMSLLFRREEDIVAWSEFRTDGRFEDVQVISQNDTDAVYAIVRRNIGGTWKRYIERFAAEDVINDEDRFHLDSFLSYELQRPDAIAEPDGLTGTVTVTTDEDAFDLLDVGSILWINGGRGTITGYTSAREIEIEVTSDLETTDTAGPGTWGFNPTVTAVSGLDHLEGKTVGIWGDRMDLGTAVVTGGGIDLPKACSVVHVGLQFTSRFKSLKLSYAAQKGTALNMPKAVKNIGFLLYKTGPSTLYFGHSFNKLVPLMLKKASTPMGEPDPLFTGEKFEAFNARYDEDARICVEWRGCAPGTIAGLIPGIDEHDR